MKRDYGFTLVELMVTLVIAAILLTAGVPSFNTLIKNNRLTTSNNELVSALNLARSEAIKRGLRVTVCKSSDQASCDTSGTGWQQGWIVFTDTNDNADYDSATETLLRVHGPLPGQLSVSGNSNVANYISYVAAGQSRLTSGAFQAGTLSLCDDRTGNIGNNLVLSVTGRIHTDTGVSCP